MTALHKHSQLFHHRPPRACLPPSSYFPLGFPDGSHLLSCSVGAATSSRAPTVGRTEADLPLSPPSAETRGEQHWDQGLTGTRGAGAPAAASAAAEGTVGQAPRPAGRKNGSSPAAQEAGRGLPPAAGTPRAKTKGCARARCERGPAGWGTGAGRLFLGGLLPARGQPFGGA